MFSENGKISKRQIRRLLIYDLFGINTLLLPVLLAKSVGRDGVFCIFGAWVLLLCYLVFLEKLHRRMKCGYMQYLKESCGAFVGTCFLLMYFVYCILLSGYALYTESALIQKCLLKEESFWLIAFFLCLIGAYGIYQGMEGRARVYELLFWFLMVPLFLMLFLAMFQWNTDYWTPVLMTGAFGAAEGIYLVVIFSGVIFLLPFLVGYAGKKTQIVSAARQAAAFNFTMNLIVFLILIGIFQVGALGRQRFPVVTLMSMVDLPGGFLKRQDAFMVAIWFFTLYAFLGTGLFYARTALKKICRAKGKFFPLFAVTAAAYALAGGFYRNGSAEGWYFKFLWYVGTPAVILMPVVAYLLEGRKRGR